MLLEVRMPFVGDNRQTGFDNDSVPYLVRVVCEVSSPLVNTKKTIQFNAGSFASFFLGFLMS